MTERWKVRLYLAATLGVAAVIMLGLPALYLTLPNPVPRPVASLTAAGRGIYIAGDGVTWRLFPRAEPLDAAPADAPVMRRPSQVVVAVRQADGLESYTLKALGRGEERVTPVTRAAGDLTRVQLDVAGLAPGTYELSVPRESIYGGSDFACFTVSR
jgi:hypothetical protein